MKFYRIRLNSSAIDQPSLIQSIKTLKGDCIQTSEGLFVAIDLNLNEFQSQITPGGETLHVEPFRVGQDPDVTPDMEKLIEAHS